MKREKLIRILQAFLSTKETCDKYNHVGELLIFSGDKVPIPEKYFLPQIIGECLEQLEQVESTSHNSKEACSEGEMNSKPPINTTDKTNPNRRGGYGSFTDIPNS